MKMRFFAAVVIAVMLSNFAAFAAVDNHGRKAKKRPVNRLVTLLPASDGVAIFETKRFLDEGLPKLLSANQPMLGEIMAKINEMENKTGIDLRKFDQVSVGITSKQVSAAQTDFEPIVIANGDINAGALIAVAKLASNGIYREEKVGERTVYVFTAQAAINNSPVQTTNSKVTSAIDKALKGLSKEIAVTSFDAKTLVIGSLPRVRETLEGTSHVSPELTALLSQKETAVMTFAFRPPGGMAKMLPLDNDELGKNLDSIQFLSGSLDVAPIGTSLQLSARTTNSQQAAGLKDTLAGLQMIGKTFLSGSKRVDQQVYARMLKNAKIDSRGADVTLDLLVPQSDIDILVAGKK